MPRVESQYLIRDSDHVYDPAFYVYLILKYDHLDTPYDGICRVHTVAEGWKLSCLTKDMWSLPQLPTLATPFLLTFKSYQISAFHSRSKNS